MWKHKFCSPSRIDTYIQFLTGYEWIFGDSSKEFTNEAFIDKLLKIEAQSSRHKADAGQICHNLFEQAGFNTLSGVYHGNGWEIILPEQDIELSYPDCREQWLGMVINGIKILGKVDGINATSIHDLKFTSKIDIEKYVNSYQWKMYLLGSGLDKMVYDIFEVKVDDKVNRVEIKNYHKLELYRYENMESEVINVLDGYLGLLGSLEPMIINRVHEYNGMIDATIEQVKSSGLVSCEVEIENFIQSLQLKKVKVVGLTDIEMYY